MGRGYEKVRKRMGKKKKKGRKMEEGKTRKRRNNKPTILQKKKKKKKNNPMGQPKNGTKGRKSTEGTKLRQINIDSHIYNDW